MSKPKVFEKPSGLKDYVPEAVAKLRQIENRVLDCMQRWGFSQLMTPTLEYYDTVGVASSTSDKRLFKLLDKHGTTLVMRSDMTAPIARVVSSLLRDEPMPLRLSYHSNVFRAIEEEAGREAEFYQTGVELIGDPSPDADAEVIALAAASLKAAGIDSFKIAIGHVGFLNGLLNEALNDRTDDQLALKQRLLMRDHVGYKDMLNSLNLTEPIRSELDGILRLRGGVEVCDQAYRLSIDPASKESIDHLKEVWKALQAYGVTDHVMIDLTMIGNFSYYTGVTFEGYSTELGFPVCSGGRYDNLLEQFGRPAPATGFALETNRMLQVTFDHPAPKLHRVLVAYDKDRREEAITFAHELRSRDGYAVETRRVDHGNGSENSKFDEIFAFTSGQKG